MTITLLILEKEGMDGENLKLTSTATCKNMTKCKDYEEGCFIWGKEKLSGGNRSVFSWSCNRSLNVIWTQQKSLQNNLPLEPKKEK